MFEGFSQEALDFLNDIRFNNNQTFYEANKARYERYVKQPMRELSDELAPVVQLIDPKLDKQLTEALKSLREGLGEAFEDEGFNSVVKALGVLPQDMPWGERIYAIARESFFQGGLYTALADDEEEENDDRD